MSSPDERRRIERERERESFVHTVNIFWLWQLAVGHGFSLFLSCTVHMSSNVRTRKEERNTRPPTPCMFFFRSWSLTQVESSTCARSSVATRLSTWACQASDLIWSQHRVCFPTPEAVFPRRHGVHAQRLAVEIPHPRSDSAFLSRLRTCVQDVKRRPKQNSGARRFLSPGRPRTGA